MPQARNHAAVPTAGRHKQATVTVDLVVCLVVLLLPQRLSPNATLVSGRRWHPPEPVGAAGANRRRLGYGDWGRSVGSRLQLGGDCPRQQEGQGLLGNPSCLQALRSTAPPSQTNRKRHVHILGLGVH